jgi:hypothetical protein
MKHRNVRSGRYFSLGGGRDSEGGAAINGHCRLRVVPDGGLGFPKANCHSELNY